MSKETKKTVAAEKPAKEKRPLDTKYIANLTVTLLLITSVTALLLGVVNYMTAPVIAAAAAEKKAAAMQQVLAADLYPAADGYTPDGGVTNLYTAVADGQTVGYVVEVTASGFGGDMEMMVGVDLDGYVTGVAVMDHGETPGVGSKVAGSQSVLDRFKGMAGDITVNAGENRFDGVSGATVSSKAVAAGVNAALQAVDSVRGLSA